MTNPPCERLHLDLSDPHDGTVVALDGVRLEIRVFHIYDRARAWYAYHKRRDPPLLR